MSDLDQERIWIEQSKKDIVHFRPIYEKYSDPLYRYFVRRTDNHELSVDLASYTFERVLRKIHQFEWQGKPFGAWLFKVASNELRKHFRKKKPVFVIEIDKVDCFPEQEIEENPDLMKAVIKELDGLDEQDLQLLELRFFEDMSFKEISNLIGIGESAAKMRVYRLLNMLRTKLMGTR